MRYAKLVFRIWTTDCVLHASLRLKSENTCAFIKHKMKIQKMQDIKYDDQVYYDEIQKMQDITKKN
jgi:hypothetical protein